MKRYVSLIISLFALINLCHGFNNARELSYFNYIDKDVYEQIEGKSCLLIIGGHCGWFLGLAVPTENGYLFFSTSKDCGKNIRNPIRTDTISGKCQILEWGLTRWGKESKSLVKIPTEGYLTASRMLYLFSPDGEIVASLDDNETYSGEGNTKVLKNLSLLEFLMDWYSGDDEYRQMVPPLPCEIDDE